MSIRKFARRLLSLSAAQGYWKSDGVRPTRAPRLGAESLEDRTVPTVTVNAPNAAGIVTVVNDAVAETVSVDTTTNAGFITFTTVTNPPVDGDGGGTAVTVTGNQAKVAVGGVKGIAVSTTAALGMIVNDIGGATDLRQVTFAGGADNDIVNLGQATFTANAGFNATAATNNANVYYNVNMGAGVNNFAFSDTGVGVLSFSDAAAASTTSVQPSATNNKAALNFKAVTTGVQANLNANAGTAVATYTNMTVNLTAGATAQKIIGVYGGAGNDLLIGNEEGNILIGFDGNDTVVGNGGADHLTSNRDFSPAIAGTATGGIATVDANTVVDVTKFATASAAFNGVTDVTQTSKDLYAAFGFFNFGEGASFVASGFTGVDFAADFAAANGVTAAASADQLFGGDGNDGLFGFNGAATSATGQGGNDVFSSNLNAAPSSYDGGDGIDGLFGAFGTTMIGGNGDDQLFYVTGNSTTSPFSSAIGGPGNDIFSVPGTTVRNVTLDASEGTDTVNADVGLNDPTNVIIVNGTTIGVGGFTSARVVFRG